MCCYRQHGAMQKYYLNALHSVQVEQLCELLDDSQISRDRDMPKQAWDFIKEKKFLGMIIPKQYGGLGFSGHGHSQVVQKIASRSGSAAVSVMVPNSLGPGELLMRYCTVVALLTL